MKSASRITNLWLQCATFLAFALPLIFFSSRSEAFQWLPEYETLTETEQATFEGPLRLGSEYQSDILAYLKPFSWEYLWLTNPMALDFSIGSISPVHFQTDNRLKLVKPLFGPMDFKFFYIDERNREREVVATVFEFEFHLLPQLSFAIYGDPSFYKRQDDVGLALIWKPQPRHEIRLFNTWVDITRVARSDRTDTFDKDYLPYSRGLVGRLWSDPAGEKRGEFFEYAFRQETKTKWMFKGPDYTYEYWRIFGSVFGAKRLSKRLTLNVRSQYDRKFESRDLTSPKEAWRTDRFLNVYRFVISNFGAGGRGEFMPGLSYAWRRWDTSQGLVAYHDLLPHFWWAFPAFQAPWGQDIWSFGYEFTWHQVKGTAAMRVPGDDNKLEHRANFAYDFNFKNTGSLRVVATFDLDKLGTGDTWEGGGAQFRIAF